MEERLVATFDANIVLDIVLSGEQSLSSELTKLLVSEQFEIPLFIFIEVEFVLARVYKFSRHDIVDNIELLLRQPWLKANRALLQSALAMYEVHPKLSLVDCCLVYFARFSTNLPLYTRDKKLAVQSGGFAQLVP